MDAVFIPHLATEQSIAPNKQIRIKTQKKNGGGGGGGNFISNPSESFDKDAGLLKPPLRAMSLSVPSVFNRQNQQPPLLPLPIHHHQHPQLSRSLSIKGFSLPPSSRKNRTRGTSLTPKKSKPTKREEAKKRSTTQSISDFLIVPSGNRWGPDPNDLPKHLPVVFTSKRPVGTVSVENIDMDMLSGSVFNLSPPPSSLPLPKFFLRSKLSCNAEAAAGVDAGATNNLRRLLRLP